MSLRLLENGFVILSLGGQMAGSERAPRYVSLDEENAQSVAGKQGRADCKGDFDRAWQALREEGEVLPHWCNNPSSYSFEAIKKIQILSPLSLKNSVLSLCIFMRKGLATW